MKNTFKGYYQPTKDDFEKMWNEGTFVFDTNVLLNLYRYKKETRDSILEVLEKLQDRIWIPYQVGLEFHRNRLLVISDQNKKMDDFKSSIKNSISEIEKQYKDLQLNKRHADINAEPILKQFQDLSKKVLEELNLIQPKKLSNCDDDDEILKNITNIFCNKVGDKPEDQKWLDDCFSDGDNRAKYSIPPSFRDIKKAKNEENIYTYDNLTYRAGYGDLILWKQLLDYAKKNHKKHIIFVTDDNKDDWMLSVHGKTICVRPELTMEIFSYSEVENFHIYNTESFLKSAESLGRSSVPYEVMKEVGELMNRKIARRKVYNRPIRRGIVNFLEEEYYRVRYLNGNVFDFSATSQDFRDVLIMFKRVDFNDITIGYIQHIIRILKQYSRSQPINNVDYHVIIEITMFDVLTNSLNDIDEIFYQKVSNSIQEYIIDESTVPNVTFTLGYLDGESKIFRLLSNYKSNINYREKSK